MTDSKPQYVTDPQTYVTSHVEDDNNYVCFVIFRGAWCPYDKHYLQKLGEYNVNTMKKSDSVKIIAWTSQGAEAAKQADEEWGLTAKLGYDEVIGDETNALANYLKEDEVLPHLVTATLEEAKVQDQVPEGSYPNGIVMPGMVWYAHKGTIALQWEAKFEEPGLGGPNRPAPAEVWREVQKRKHALDHGNAVMPVHGSELKMCTNSFDMNCTIL